MTSSQSKFFVRAILFLSFRLPELDKNSICPDSSGRPNTKTHDFVQGYFNEEIDHLKCQCLNVVKLDGMN